MTLDEEVKNELRQLALTNFDKFLEVTGVDLTTLKICKQHERGKSLQQIANLMQMPKTTISRRCKVC